MDMDMATPTAITIVNEPHRRIHPHADEEGQAAVATVAATVTTIVITRA